MNEYGYQRLIILLGLVLIFSTACNDSPDSDSQQPAPAAAPAVSAVETPEIEGGEPAADCLPEGSTSLEGKTITAGGVDLEVLSVSAAVIDLADHLGAAAIEGGVAAIPEDDNALILNCVSQVY